MEYTIVFTHNPQDYFNGYEPPDLVLVTHTTGNNLQKEIVPMVTNGYHAIIFPEK